MSYSYMKQDFQKFWQEIAARGWQRQDRVQLLSFCDWLAQQCVAGTDADIEDEPLHDRLFDIIIRGFEQLQPYRAGIQKLARDIRHDPATLHVVFKKAWHNNLWLMRAIKLDPSGHRGKFWQITLMVILARGWQVWLTDDGQNLSATVAAIDKSLKLADAALHKIVR